MVLCIVVKDVKHVLDMLETCHSVQMVLLTLIDQEFDSL